jgi:hypothetical protein
MTVTAVLDASVLYPAPVRDLLIRVANADLLQARWTSQILDEVFRAISARRPDLSVERLARTRKLMELAIPDADVLGYESLVPALQLPDPADRHVLAAAIRCHAQVIATDNTRDFPAATLAHFGIDAMEADQVLLSLVDLTAPTVWRVVREQAAALRRPPRSPGQLLEIFRRCGLERTVAALESWSGE